MRTSRLRNRPIQRRTMGGRRVQPLYERKDIQKEKESGRLRIQIRRRLRVPAVWGILLDILYNERPVWVHDEAEGWQYQIR